MTTFPASPLPITVQLLLNGTWTDISAYVYQRNTIVITRGRPNEASQIQPGSLTLTLNNRDGRFSPKNTSSPYYPFITRNTQIRLSVNATSAASVTYSGFRFWGEVSTWPPQWDVTGNDIYVQIQAGGILRRYVQGKLLGSSLRRFYMLKTDATAPVAYWPCEEGNGAALFGNLIIPGDDMTFAGTPTIAGNSSFPGSDPIPLVSKSTWTGSTGSFSSGGPVTYSTPGTYMFTAPGGVSSLTSAQCWGGGGGGGGGTGIAIDPGGGGGGGEFAQESTVAVTPGNNYTVVVGSGGSGAGSDGSSGSNGGNSSFTGDSVTVTAHGGTGGVGGTLGGGSGAGGTGSTNTTHHNGGAGGGWSGSGSGGSGGGSSAGTAAAGNAGSSNSTDTGGTGGSAPTGGGAGGAGGTFIACVDIETEIFTRDGGWKRYDEILPGDETLAINTYTGEPEWATIERVNVHEGTWKMTVIRHPWLSVCVNAEHRWLIRNGNTWTYKQTRDLQPDDQFPIGDRTLVRLGLCSREEIEITGVIWCPTTALGNWLARRDGTGYYIGNKP